MQYSFDNGYGTKYYFDIVDKIPAGMEVWNIGENMRNDELIPFCFLVPGSHEIIPSLLKAVKLDPADVKILRYAAHNGLNNLTACTRYIKRFERGTGKNKRRYNLALQAAPIFENITDKELKIKIIIPEVK